ncbi:hypothetical protein C370_07239 [Cryptococcus neoformans A1-35-8]|nr:hypothetical protein C370_07239 [Cryptococcus neoformans var. grubii A1-35-8]
MKLKRSTCTRPLSRASPALQARLDLVANEV